MSDRSTSRSEARKHFWPTLVLFFLAPTIGELLSGSAPPAEFFHPLMLLLLAALYGSGAILVRELRVRWRKGWPTVLVLGAAYGIVEEGLMVKSFFDPNWVDLGLLGTYGRWAGVNWVWSLQLTIYHAVFSIGIPILLVELLFPTHRDERWLGRRGMVGFALLLASDVAFGALFLTPYRPPVVPYLLTGAIVVGLFLLARRLPGPRPATEPHLPAVPVARLALLGFGATLAFFLIHWVLPALKVPVLLTVVAAVGLVVGVARTVGRWARRGLTDLQRLALAGGALTFFVLLAPLQELDEARPDNTAGMALVGLGMLVFLLRLWRRVRVATERRSPDAA